MLTLREDHEIESLLMKSEALLKGHFILSSGLHSNRYVQCAKFFQYPAYAELAAKKLAKLYEDPPIDVVIGGAFGGITIAYELARVLGVRGIFCERVEGVFQLRRGFEIRQGEKVLIAEDVVTTGKSIDEVAQLVKQHGGEVVGVASLVDRHMPDPEKLPYRFEWLHSVQAEAYDPADCLLCKEGKLPAVKPGSRGMK
ncbi:orotate phosphoribosyltransferase [Thermospira aquatica]|uniref:Orotate phosphoribosyltransferase n=1 Tax=Thermospira aquatica TaxID=2828656 RepID=A0AAX3BBX2_9SPIR|nr:orotate phosphoribosyltransferase [Thermospira aquatica]URA09600.1 orotate phosphoribosyltransferase [Thermospira aquatica]